MNKLFDHLQTYRIELALEEIRRKTDVKASPVNEPHERQDTVPPLR